MNSSSLSSMSEPIHSSSSVVMALAPTRVIRGAGILPSSGDDIARLGQRPLVIGGDRTLHAVQPFLDPALSRLQVRSAVYHPDCSEVSLATLRDVAIAHDADVIIGVGGGKALDTAKLLAHQHQVPVVTVPTSAATCAAWTALSNIYTEAGGFLYDVSLTRCPDLLILDYDLVQTAAPRTLISGIGDALAKWYEASVSSGHSDQALIIAAVQQARVLRDLLFQKSVEAIRSPGSSSWRDVVDASILLAGVIGGLGGAQCRTVAAHAIHNGLTHLPESHHALHGEKVAYGILVQLRLEEMIQGNGLAASSRQQLLKFYGDISLPRNLAELGLATITIEGLERAAEIACNPQSDIHHLPFEVTPTHLMAAMVSTTAPCHVSRASELESCAPSLYVSPTKEGQP
ncbi:MAG TPA: iron-containing alcohol dehydrogenase family protein [Elainellaceae cyanobacterium]